MDHKCTNSRKHTAKTYLDSHFASSWWSYFNGFNDQWLLCFPCNCSSAGYDLNVIKLIYESLVSMLAYLTRTCPTPKTNVWQLYWHWPNKEETNSHSPPLTTSKQAFPACWARGQWHKDLHQNMRVERDYRTGHHVYEASFQIFKHTWLDTGQANWTKCLVLIIVSSNIIYYDLMQFMSRCLYLWFIYISSVSTKGKICDLPWI